MSSFRIRPRFKKVVNTSIDELVSLLTKELKENKEARFTGLVSENYTVIKIPMKDRHFWSPQLTISYDEIEEGTEIRGLYGPNPTVWAVFFFGYAVLGVVGLFILVMWFSRVSLGMPTNIFWVLPGLGIGAVILYLVAQAGQKIGANQMYDLHHFFEETISKKIDINII